MAHAVSELKLVEDFLGFRRIVVAGVSRNPQDFTRKLFAELRRRGYDAVPVNPHVQEVDGIRCFASVVDVPPPVEGVLLLTSPEVTERVVRDCAEAGVRRVWIYRPASEASLKLCKERGIDVVAGECPYMFLQDAAWPHRVHGYCQKLFGRYPR